MSRRFGRNQRRALREQVATLRTADTMNRELLRHTTRRLQAAQAEIDDARRVLGTYSAALAPQTMRMPARSTDSHGRLVVNRHEPLPFSAPSQPLAQATFHTEPLQAVIARVKDSPGVGSHVRVEFGDSCWAYALSDGALHSLPTDLLAREIAQSLARTIAVQLKSRTGKDHHETRI